TRSSITRTTLFPYTTLFRSGKASRQDLDTVTNTVSKLDTQLKETAKGVEISVKKDELGGEIAEALTNKTNILLGTRRFTTNNWQDRKSTRLNSSHVSISYAV